MGKMWWAITTKNKNKKIDANFKHYLCKIRMVLSNLMALIIIALDLNIKLLELTTMFTAITFDGLHIFFYLVTYVG